MFSLYVIKSEVALFKLNQQYSVYRTSSGSKEGNNKTEMQGGDPQHNLQLKLKKRC